MEGGTLDRPLDRDPQTETPWTETPRQRHPSKQRPPKRNIEPATQSLEGTWGHAARQEVTSYRDLCGQTDTSENITLLPFVGINNENIFSYTSKSSSTGARNV